MPAPEITVVGSVNLDLSIVVPHLPLPGETVLGGDALWSSGGKGANQAVAAARLGRRVGLVAAVGDDDAGRSQRATLAGEGLDLEGLVTVSTPTGVATIAVDASGENSIVVSSGANAHLAAETVRASASVAEAAVVMTQFEVPLATVRAAVETASGFVVVNPAPVSADLSESDRAHVTAIIEGADVMVPNRGELSVLVGEAPASTSVELVDQAKMVGRPTIVTLGSHGALVVEANRVSQIPPVPVTAVDTTAAGDAFCAGVADAVVHGASLVEAAMWASRVAAVTVTRRGAQSSLPARMDVLAQTASAEG